MSPHGSLWNAYHLLKAATGAECMDTRKVGLSFSPVEFGPDGNHIPASRA